MPSLMAAFRSEIARLAKKEARRLVEPARKSAAAARHDIAAIKRRLRELERVMVAVSRKQAKVVGSGAVLEDGIKSRFRAQGVKAHRDRLALSAEDYGRLLGVSSQTVYNWEQGKARPTREKLAALFELRSLGKREAARRLRPPR